MPAQHHHSKNDAATDHDYAERPVPESQRIPRYSLMMAWWAVCSAIFYMVVAAAMARSYGTLNALVGIVLTVIAYSLINAVISRYAIRTGLNVSQFSQRLFGRAGALIATLIFCATALYYAVFEGYVMALVLSEWSTMLPMTISTAIVAALGVSLIFGSVQHWLDRFNGVLLPVYVAGMLIALGVAFDEFGYPSGWLTRQPESGTTFWGWAHTFAYYMGVWVLMMFTFDYARLGRPQDEGFHSRITFGTPFYAMTFLFSAVIGILLDAAIPSDGLSEASIVLGLLELMGFGGLLLVWVTQSRINTANFYLATINFEALTRAAGVRLHRIGAGCLIGLLAWFLMMADVFGYILQALAWQGIFVVAWVGVALAHILRYPINADTDGLSQRTPAWRSQGLIAWGVASLTGVIIMNVPPVASFSAPVTFLTALTLYALWAAHRRTASSPGGETF